MFLLEAFSLWHKKKFGFRKGLSCFEASGASKHLLFSKIRITRTERPYAPLLHAVTVVSVSMLSVSGRL